MSKVYLPTSDQMNTTLENLSRIASALGTRADVSSWTAIERVVKSGNASQMFPIGTQFTVAHSEYGDMVFEVVAHDYFKSAEDENAHTMTLMSRDHIRAMQFDNAEAFYYADSKLPAGTYHFTLATAYASWAAGTYQFTLTKDLPQGGQLCISGGSQSVMTTNKVAAYASGTITEASEMVEIISGNAGTNLGIFGKELNHIQRVSYGSNNYKESAVRQFLNSDASAGSVWTPQTKFDRPPSWVTSVSGFMFGFSDREFLSVVGDVIVPCVANNTYESPDSTTVKGGKYILTDKFYLASEKEVFGTTDHEKDDNSVLFPYYDGATNADRVKYRNGSAAVWWMRTPGLWHATIIRAVHSDGSMYDYYGALTSNGCVPVCTIV